MKDKVQAIIGHGINCFVNRQLVYNYPEELFADAGIMAIEHADFDGIERLALVTGVGRTAPWELFFTCNAMLTLSPSQGQFSIVAIRHAHFDGIVQMALTTSVL